MKEIAKLSILIERTQNIKLLKATVLLLVLKDTQYAFCYHQIIIHVDSIFQRTSSVEKIITL